MAVTGSCEVAGGNAALTALCVTKRRDLAYIVFAPSLFIKSQGGPSAKLVIGILIGSQTAGYSCRWGDGSINWN